MGIPKHVTLCTVGASLLLSAALLRAEPAAPLVNPTAAAKPAPAAPAAPAGEMTVDAVLDALDKRGQDLRSFDGKVALTEDDVALQLKSTRTGRVWYQKKGEDNARIRVSFDKRADEKAVRDEKIEYLLDGVWLTDRDYQKKIQVRRQVLRPGEKIDLLKLGEGPFPLPIGQKKEDVKKLFTVTKVKPAKDDPPATVHLLLKPIKGTRYAKKFSAIDVWMDTQAHFPRRIDTLDVKEQVSRSTELTDIRVNPEIGDKEFSLEGVPDSQWNQHEEPFSE